MADVSSLQWDFFTLRKVFSELLNSNIEHYSYINKENVFMKKFLTIVRMGSKQVEIVES